ncbi:phage major capsid protein [Enterobacter asburiae]|uniref:phage major capsid protein n=1 Tax=Enterobacter asburiae TaxID=61645 RepID=UPI00192C20EF|nr:phage major capsid protein [Enterobacter asburiae]MBL5912166.1 phage major capsid protein [Enterobacter asburiae]
MSEKFKGIMAIRAGRAIALSKGMSGDAVEMTRNNDPLVSAYIEKSAVSGLTSSGVPAVAADPIAVELGGHIFSQTVPGQLMEMAMNLPFGAPVHSISAMGAGWVREGEGVPVSGGEVGSNKIKPYKIASLAVINKEVLFNADTGTNLTLRNVITSAAVKKIDEKFMSADEVQDKLSPAGVLFGAAAASSTIGELMRTHAANGNDIKTSALIVPLLDVGVNITELDFKLYERAGVKIIISQYANNIAMIDASKMIINVMGTIIDSSEEGSIEMESEPVNDINDPQPAKMINLFQENAIAMRAVTYCSWEVLGKAVTYYPAIP